MTWGKQQWIALLIAALILVVTGNGLAEQPTGMFQLYDQNKTDGIPNYITEDFILLSYGMMVNTAVTRMEETVFLPALNDLVEKMKNSLQASHTPAEQACLDFISVLAALLSGDAGDVGRPEVLAELNQIRNAEAMAVSSLMHQKNRLHTVSHTGKIHPIRSFGTVFSGNEICGDRFFSSTGK